MVQRASVLTLVDSTFAFNYLAADNTTANGVGIVSYGQVHCKMAHCLPVCTLCQEDTADMVDHTVDHKGTTQAVFVYLLGLLGTSIILSCGIIRWCPAWCQSYTAHRHLAQGQSTEEFDEATAPSIGFLMDEQSVEVPTIELFQIEGNVPDEPSVEDLRAEGDVPDEPSVEDLRAEGDLLDEPSVEVLRAERFVMASYMSSPAPILVIGRRGMDVIIKLCSRGMMSLVPTHADPVGGLLTDFPFVNTRDGARLCETVTRIFETSAECDNTMPFMLFLHTHGGVVLLEMSLNVLITASDPVIVMTGCEVDSHFGSLISGRDERTASESEDFESQELITELDLMRTHQACRAALLHNDEALEDFAVSHDSLGSNSAADLAPGDRAMAPGFRPPPSISVSTDVSSLTMPASFTSS